MALLFFMFAELNKPITLLLCPRIYIQKTLLIYFVYELQKATPVKSNRKEKVFKNL